MKQLARLSCILSLLFACQSNDQPQPSDEMANLELQVMTFNIRYGAADDGADSWPYRKDFLFEVIRESGADLIGLQEALRFQIDEIRAALPQYDEIGVGRDDGKSAGEYSAILFLKHRFDVQASGTFWFSDTPETPGSMTWGNSFPRVCTWGEFADKTLGRKFYMYNLHLDHISQPSREKSALLLAQRITTRPDAEPVIVTGDFNAGEDNPAVLFLLGKETPLAASGKMQTPLVDTFRALWPEATEVGTFNGFSGDRSGGKIDHVLASPELQTLQAEIVHAERAGKYPSDHFPVTARVRLPAK